MLRRLCYNQMKSWEGSDHMQWYELFNDGCEPSDDQIQAYIDSPIWVDLANYMRDTYRVKLKLSYSNCGMQNGYWKGWNIKFKKGGKALCTVYPKQGYCLAIIPVSDKEAVEAELLMPQCCEAMQNLYSKTASGAGYRSLAVEIRDDDMLRDAKLLVALRAKKS